MAYKLFLSLRHKVAGPPGHEVFRGRDGGHLVGGLRAIAQIYTSSMQRKSEPGLEVSRSLH